MVPVKLVSVPGHGGAMRMVRVSPVKGGEIATSTASLPPRAVVIKSSLLRPVSSSMNSNSNYGSSNNSSTDSSSSSSSSNPSATNSTVQFPAPNPSSSICDSIVPPASADHPAVLITQESSALSRLKDAGESAPSKPLEGEVNRLNDCSQPPASNIATSQPAPVKRQASSTSPKISKNQLKPQGDSDQDLISISHQQLPLESRLDEVEEVVKPLPHPVALDKSDKGFFGGSSDLMPVQSQRTVPVLTNGDTANAEITDLITLSSARRVRNGGGSIKSSSNGSDLNGDIDSLLKPLATSSTTVASVIVKDGVLSDDVVDNFDVPEVDTPSREASPQDPSSVSPPPGGVLLPPATGKRSRRDTGSSVQSDRSDLSAVSSVTGLGTGNGQEPAAKRVKDEKGRRGSTSPGAREPSSRIQDRRKPDDASNQLNSDAKSVSANKKKAVKSEPTKKLNIGVSNGLKHNSNTTLKPKTIAASDKTKVTPTSAAKIKDKKNVGVKTAQATKNLTGATNAGAAVNKGVAKTAAVLSKIAPGGVAATVVASNAVTGGKAVVEKVGAGDAGRRVSARVKKPDEKSTETKRKR